MAYIPKPETAESLRLDRFVYVIEFTSDTVKVGQAWQPSTRMRAHEKAALAHGHRISRSWVSPAHAGYPANENALIAFCEARWSRRTGREYFAGADFDAVVEYAQGLRYVAASTEEVEAASQRGRGLFGDLREGLWERFYLSDVDRAIERLKLVGSLANEANREDIAEQTFEIVKHVASLTGPAWAESDPTAAERYLVARGAKPESARDRAPEFELSMRTLYALQYMRFPDSFEDLARHCDAVRGAA